MTSTPINQLGTIQSQTDLRVNDLLRLYSQRFGGEIGLSLVMLAEYIQGRISTASLTTQYEAPTATGFTARINDANTWLVLTPNAAYATGTIALPAATQGQEVSVNCTQAVTTLLISTTGDDTVVGAPTTLAANDFFTLRYDDTLDRWYRVG